MPPHLAALLTLAAQALRAGRPAEAIAPLRAVAQALPRNAGILHDLGLACLECGRVAEAISALQSSIEIDPDFADSHLRLGIALELAGAADAALGAYRLASDLDSTLADASYRAGNLLDNLGRVTEAVEAFRRAAAPAPRTTLGLIATARALLGESRHPEAEQTLREALAREPDNPIALDLLGNALADAGRFEEAREYLDRAIQRAPRLSGSYYDIARCRRMGPEDAELIARMRAALELPDLEPAQKSRVHLALGKAADDLGDPEEAMRQYDAAEKLRNGLVRFDLAAFNARIDRLIACFTRERIVAADWGRHEDAIPVFVLGLPRSGTTLVEQMLSAHSQVAAGGELPFWNERGRDWERAGDREPTVALTAADYLRLLRAIAPAAARVIDKNPLNFQWAGLINICLPGATLIHCRRAPIDTAISIHQTHFNPRMAFPTGGETLVGYIRAYQRLVAHWRDVLPPERWVEIDYEVLVSDPEPVVRRLLMACGLDFDPVCLHPNLNRRVVKTASKWQARQPIYTSAIDRWRIYEPWLGPLRALVS